MRTLKQKGVNIYATNRNGSNAVHMAVKRGDSHILNELVVNMNMDVNIQKLNGVTALSIAALNKNHSMFNFLLQNGADPLICNKQGIGSLYFAVKGRD